MPKTKQVTSSEQLAAIGTLGQQAAAKLIGKPTSYLRDHSHWIPRNADGTYSGAALVEAVLAKETRKASEAATADELRRMQAEEDLRKTQLQVERLQLEVDQTTEKLIDRTTVVSVLSSLSATLVEQLSTIPDEIAPSLPVEMAPEIIEDIRAGVQRKLQAFAEQAARDILKGGRQ